VDEFIEYSSIADEFVIGPDFNYFARPHDGNTIEFPNSIKAVRDRDYSALSLPPGFEQILNLLLRSIIEGGGRFVEDENPGRLEQDPGDGEFLFLAAGKPFPF